MPAAKGRRFGGCQKGTPNKASLVRAVGKGRDRRVTGARAQIGIEPKNGLVDMYKIAALAQSAACGDTFGHQAVIDVAFDSFAV